MHFTQPKPSHFVNPSGFAAQSSQATNTPTRMGNGYQSPYNRRGGNYIGNRPGQTFGSFLGHNNSNNVFGQEGISVRSKNGFRPQRRDDSSEHGSNNGETIFVNAAFGNKPFGNNTFDSKLLGYNNKPVSSFQQANQDSGSSNANTQTPISRGSFSRNSNASQGPSSPRPSELSAYQYTPRPPSTSTPSSQYQLGFLENQIKELQLKFDKQNTQSGNLNEQVKQILDMQALLQKQITELIGSFKVFYFGKSVLKCLFRAVLILAIRMRKNRKISKLFKCQKFMMLKNKI